MARQSLDLHPGRKQLLLLVLIAGAVYVLLPQFGSFRSSWALLEKAQAGYTLKAVVLTAATFAAGAATYCFLAFKPLRYGRTLAVQMAATFVNRLLPAGIGALGANYLYLRRQRHTAAQAGSVVAVNNLLGIIGHMLLLGVVLALVPGHVTTAGTWRGPDADMIARVVAGIALAAALAFMLFGRRRLGRALKDFKAQLSTYRSRPLSLFGALMTSMTLTLCNTWCVYFCLKALGLHLSFAAVLLVFTLALGAGSAVPTPGGLGGFEAGLAVGFVGYGIDAAPALATALLYRLISYWLPLIFGAIAFIWCEKTGVISLSG